MKLSNETLLSSGSTFNPLIHNFVLVLHKSCNLFLHSRGVFLCDVFCFYFYAIKNFSAGSNMI